jgi:hypothetical protein
MIRPYGGALLCLGALGCAQLLGLGDGELADGGPGASDGGALRVFVTQQTHKAYLNNAAGADQICDSAASTATQPLGGVWTAYLTDSAGDPIGRITANGPWYLVDQTTLVFADRQALLGTTALLDRDENGAQVLHSDLAWLGVKRDGGSCDCWNWTTYSLAGGAQQQIGSWGTAGTCASCDGQAHLYCIEQ